MVVKLFSRTQMEPETLLAYRLKEPLWTTIFRMAILKGCIPKALFTTPYLDFSSGTSFTWMSWMHSVFKNQKLPLDFVSERFCTERKEAIEERLQLISTASLPELYQMMDNVWSTQMGCLSIISWDSCDLSQLKEIVCCMGNGPLVAICDRLLRHFRFTRSGFPDLLVWDISSRKIKAIEVKGPGDSLSSKQILWLEYFNNCCLPAEVCYVKAAKWFYNSRITIYRSNNTHKCDLIPIILGLMSRILAHPERAIVESSSFLAISRTRCAPFSP